MLTPISGLAEAIPTRAPPAATEKPHCFLSFFKGVAKCSAPQFASHTAASKTNAQIHVLISAFKDFFKFSK
jgi:hypothetical protein